MIGYSLYSRIELTSLSIKEQGGSWRRRGGGWGGGGGRGWGGWGQKSSKGLKRRRNILRREQRSERGRKPHQLEKEKRLENQDPKLLPETKGRQTTTSVHLKSRLGPTAEGLADIKKREPGTQKS